MAKPPKTKGSAPAGVRECPGFMTETNGGSSIERVPGFDISRAMTEGFKSTRISGPTILAGRPDGATFSVPKVILPPGATPHPPAGSVPRPENVLGFDDRVQIADTTAVPWRCICHLEITYDSGAVGLGSGWLAGARVVVTAGHCLHDRENRRKAKSIRVIPGRNGPSAPYGYVVADTFYVPDPWIKLASQAEAAAFDYGVIELPSVEVENEQFGTRIGFFGMRAYSGAAAEKDLQMLMINNAGYPFEADKPYGTLWFNAGRVSSVRPAFLEYMIDTEGGQSGSPVFVFDSFRNERQVVAIHTTGDFVNRGLRITDAVFDWISQRIAAAR